MPQGKIYSFLVVVATAASTDSRNAYKFSADLSYQPFANVGTILSSPYKEDIATVDLTGSMLGDHTLSTLDIATLRELKAPMNRLSSSSAIQLFEQLGQSNHQQRMHTLDLGFNPLFIGEEPKKFRRSLRTLLASPSCPTELLLECTGMDAAGCRAMAKGMISRQAKETDNDKVRPMSLYLSNNPDIGDAGAVAIAAALRTVRLDTLDLSNTNTGDVGAEALAISFDKVAIRRLVLSHNKIGNQGLSALCRAVPPETLILDGNDRITDTGMNAVSEMITTKREIPHLKLSLRSCNLRASGAERIGKALRRLLSQNTETRLEIDLSGNPLGVLRGNTKSDSKYSASRLKSTVSATASAYMSQGMNMLKKGFGSTIESDDDEEMNDEDYGEKEDPVDQDRCGLKALVNAFLFDGEEEIGQKNLEISSTEPRSVTLGLRHTFCDTAGAEALAALLVTANSKFNTNISLDMTLNPVLDEELVDALHGDNDELLHEMSDRHLESMEMLQLAKMRARLAAKATSARLRRQDDLEDEWGNVDDMYSDHPDLEEEDDMESQMSDD